MRLPISNRRAKSKQSLPHFSHFFLSRKISLIVKAMVLKTTAHQVACGFESCIFRQFLLGFVAQRNKSARIRILRLRVQILPKPPNHFGVVQLAGRLTLNQETKVQILSPKPNLFYFWAFRRWLYGLVLETSVRKFESCRPDQVLNAPT